MEYKQTFSHFAELSAALLSVDRDELKKAIELLRKTKERRRYVWIVGNGGSAATAEHLANDLTKMCGIKAIAIPSMTPTMTAYGNDEGWQNMFACPMDVFFEPGDVVVAISCSGRSPNVLQAVANLDDVIILTGNDIGSPLIGRRASAILVAESSDITIQEDVHLAICHAIAKALAK